MSTQFPRPPCSHCRATAVTVHAAAFDATLTFDATVSAALTPGERGRGWGRRWKEAQRDLQDLLAPSAAPLSADTIHAAGQRLQAFYVQTYHIKDALINEASTTGVPSDAVEEAISTQPALALLADLANFDKHSKLTKSRSGQIPSVKCMTGDTANCAPGTWRLRLAIDHGGKSLDGLSVAEAAVDAWRRVLSGWGLI